MKTFLILSSILLTTSIYAEDGANCSIGEPNAIYTAKWQEKEMCLDPFSTICKYSDDSDHYYKRAQDTLDVIKQNAMDSVYNRFGASLKKRGILGISNHNFNKVTSSAVQACINDNECSSSTQLPDSLSNKELDVVVEALTKIEYMKKVNSLMDKKLDMAHEAYKLVQEKMVQIVKKELSKKLTSDELKQQVDLLKETKGLFSSSKKSLDFNFPNLTDEQKKVIGDDFDKTCFNDLDHIHNQFFTSHWFDNVEYNIVITCPAETFASLQGANTLHSIYSVLAFGLAHELGHEISFDRVKDNMMDKYNECMKSTIPSSELSSSPEDYTDESEADFWAKRFLGESLKEMKDYPVEEKIHFLKETFMGICESEDDGIHHSTKLRVNKTLRITPEFRDTFNCSAISHQMRLREPIDCGLDGAKYIMVPEL